MQKAWVRSLVRELDPTCHNEDLVQQKTDRRGRPPEPNHRKNVLPSACRCRGGASVPSSLRGHLESYLHREGGQAEEIPLSLPLPSCCWRLPWTKPTWKPQDKGSWETQFVESEENGYVTRGEANRIQPPTSLQKLHRIHPYIKQYSPNHPANLIKRRF